MPDETGKHWTEDEDLLARFVLGNLDAREASSLEQHLAECARCADAVRAEQVIAAGLKRAGREELKQRLAQRLGQHRSYKFNWYQAAGIAAAVVLLVTVAIRDDWFFGSVEKQSEYRQKPDTVVLSEQKAPALQTEFERPQTDAVKSETSGREAKPIADAVAKKKKEAMDEKRTLSLQEVKKSQPIPTMLGKGVAQAEQAQPALMTVAAGAQELWTQGTLIRTNVVTRFADKAVNIAADAKRISDAAKANVIGIDSSNVSVTQLPASALPARQQRARGAGEVQTLFRQGPQGLQIVLFGDTLLTPHELDQARLEPVGPDSLILIAGQKRIGYKTPPGWLRQQIPPRAR